MCAAGGSQTEEGRLERLRREEVGGDVALQVIDRDQRQAAGGGDRLRGRDADQEGADQPRPDRDRDRLDLVERHPGLLQRGADDRRRQLQVMARGDLGDDAAEARVGGGLRGDHVGEDPPAGEDGGAARWSSRRKSLSPGTACVLCSRSFALIITGKSRSLAEGAGGDRWGRAGADPAAQAGRSSGPAT